MDEFRRVRERLERKKGKVSAEHLESAALRELIDEQRNAMKLDTGGEETYEYVVVVLDALRKRTTIVDEDISALATEHTGKGNVIIEPLDKDGKFIQVKNVSEGPVNIGGWTLTNSADDKDVSYKFHRAINLEAGEVTTVWSSDSREVCNGARHLVRGLVKRPGKARLNQLSNSRLEFHQTTFQKPCPIVIGWMPFAF